MEQQQQQKTQKQASAKHLKGLVGRTSGLVASNTYNLGKENSKLKVSLGYMVRLCLK